MNQTGDHQKQTGTGQHSADGAFLIEQTSRQARRESSLRPPQRTIRATVERLSCGWLCYGGLWWSAARPVAKGNFDTFPVIDF